MSNSARALDRGRQVQHLVQLPRPHVLVVPVAVRVDRVQLRAPVFESAVANSVTSWPRATSPSVSSDVIVSTEPDLGGGMRRGDRRDVGDSQRRIAVSRAACGSTARRVEVLAGDLASRVRACRS